MSSTRLLPIGEVAETTGIAVSAVRYYADIGVISTASRVGGKRRFDADTVGRVSFIRRAQEVGFSLDEIRRILDDEHRCRILLYGAGTAHSTADHEGADY